MIIVVWLGHAFLSLRLSCVQGQTVLVQNSSGKYRLDSFYLSWNTSDQLETLSLLAPLQKLWKKECKYTCNQKLGKKKDILSNFINKEQGENKPDIYKLIKTKNLQMAVTCSLFFLIRKLLTNSFSQSFSPVDFLFS